MKIIKNEIIRVVCYRLTKRQQNSDFKIRVEDFKSLKKLNRKAILKRLKENDLTEAEQLKLFWLKCDNQAPLVILKNEFLVEEIFKEEKL
jgi:hypothetical protein